MFLLTRIINASPIRSGKILNWENYQNNTRFPVSKRCLLYILATFQEKPNHLHRVWKTAQKQDLANNFGVVDYFDSLQSECLSAFLSSNHHVISKALKSTQLHSQCCILSWPPDSQRLPMQAHNKRSHIPFKSLTSYFPPVACSRVLNHPLQCPLETSNQLWMNNRQRPVNIPLGESEPAVQRLKRPPLVSTDTECLFSGFRSSPLPQRLGHPTVVDSRRNWLNFSDAGAVRAKLLYCDSSNRRFRFIMASKSLLATSR